MKNSLYVFMAAGLTSAVLLTSCRDNDRVDDVAPQSVNNNILDKASVRNATLDKQLDYKNFYLKEAAKLIKTLGISNRDLLDLAIAAESRGQAENAVLLNDIIALAKERSFASEKTALDKISELSEAFVGLENRNYNISIYIPFAGQIKNTNRNAVEKEIFIFEAEDRSDIEYFEGYILNEDGNYVTYSELINEDLAENLAVDGVMVAIIGLEDKAFDSNASGGTPAASQKHFRIGTMAVKSHKESWAAGASDIAIQMYKYENNSVQKINFINEPNAVGGAHYYFAKFSRNEVRRQTEKNIYAPVAGMINTNPGVFTDSRFYYVIYETDNWPTTNRTVNFTLPYGQPLKINFGSSDSEYFNSNSIGNKLPLSSPQIVNNSEIKFTSYLQ